MTILNVDKPIFTSTRDLIVEVECLTDQLQAVTTGKIVCILNNNLLLDIKEVKNKIVTFNIHIPDNFERGSEMLLRFLYSGSYQTDKCAVSTILLFDRTYEQEINAEIIAEDYYCNRKETVKFKSYIKTEDDIEISGKAVLKLDSISLGVSRIINNEVVIEARIPSMILNEHVLLWKYGTNKGLFINSSMLYLSPIIEEISSQYYRNMGVSEQIREFLHR